MTKFKKVMIAGIPILLAAFLTAGAAVYVKHDKGDGNSGVLIDHGGGNCVNTGSQGMVNCNTGPVLEKDSYRLDAAPSGSGPWGFRVVDTVVDGTDIGLTVRSCPYARCGCTTAHCEKIGIVRNGSLVYARCRFDSGYNGNDTTTDWLSVTWPTNRPGDPTSRVASPDDPHVGWVLEKYTTPAGHNGRVPSCPAPA